MSDALPLLPRPKLEEYEALAKRLRAECQTGDVDDIRKWATDWITALLSTQSLSIMAR